MSTPLRVLILEDRPADAELMLRELRRAGFEPDGQRVETEQDYLAALDPALEVILADYALPQFDALRALHLLQERALDIPFIVITGSISEEAAVECMKQGAADYLLKDRLVRLGQAVAHELEQRCLRDEKRRADQALRESEERYRSLFERVPVGLYRTTLEGQILDGNLALVQILGYPDRESLRAVNMPDNYVGPEERRRWQALINRQGVVRDFEVQWRRHDGTIIWVKESAWAVRDAEGQVLYYEGAVEDITERKRAEEALRESEEDLRAIFNSVGDGIALIDMTGKVTKINNRIIEIGGYTEEEIVGRRMKLLKMFPPQSLVKMLSNFAKLISGQYCPPFDVEVYTKAGEKLDVELRGSLLRKRGKAMGLVGVMRDITERKRAEEALRESEERYRTILENIEDGYFEVDIAGNFTFFNRVVVQLCK
jgi:PAS domain S-box-containing protein